MKVKINKKNKKYLLIGLAFILFLFGALMYPQLTKNNSAQQVYTIPAPNPTYYNPTFNPNTTVSNLATPAPTIAPQPTIEPTYITVNVEPSSIPYQDTAYVTITSDSGDFYVNLYIDSVSPQHAWANMVVPVWVDSSTNTGTYEMQKTAEGYWFPPDAQYNIHGEWDDESSNMDSIWIYLA